MEFAVIISWVLLLVLFWDAGNTIRTQLAGNAEKTASRSVLSVLLLVAMALFFAAVIQWNELVPVPLWWLAASMVAAAAGLTASVCSRRSRTPGAFAKPPRADVSSPPDRSRP